MKSPITDKTLGVNAAMSEKFREVRAKAQDEYVERCKKKKKKPIVITPIPAHYVGDRIVLVDEGKIRQYTLMEVIDFCENWTAHFVYYGIILKTTDPEMLDRIGRITHENKYGYCRASKSENIPEDSIKWLDGTHTENRTIVQCGFSEGL